MPIMSAMDRNDARASARVLAETTKRCLDGQLVGSDHRTELRGMFRFLNAYRSHGFVGYEYTPRSTRGAEALSLRPSPDRHVADLRSALEESLKDAYGDDASPEEAVDRVDAVIRAVATSHAKPDDSDRALVFLEALISRLKGW